MNKNILMAVICCLSLVFLSACLMPSKTRRTSSSVVTYLYPDTSDHVETPAIPQLALPLKVGVAFVPGGNLHAVQKMELMKQISEHFTQYDFVESIELIPSEYLVDRGSFSNLDQIRTMYGIDVAALISYD